jgi:hypothetical protein
MLLVRYVALVALVVWIGAMAVVLFADLFARPLWLASACGAVIVVCLFVMKFVGPPPRAFIPRTAITVLMLVLVGASIVLRTAPATLLVINLALGLVLLAWYVRE